MDVPHSRQVAPASAAAFDLPGRQARRRRCLGVGLIVLAVVWLGLRLGGYIGDAPAPMYWVQWVAALLAPAIGSDFASWVLQAVGVLLAAYGIHRK